MWVPYLMVVQVLKEGRWGVRLGILCTCRAKHWEFSSERRKPATKPSPEELNKDTKQMSLKYYFSCSFLKLCFIYHYLNGQKYSNEVL